MKRTLLAPLLAFSLMSTAYAQCAGCEDTSGPEDPIPAVKLQTQGLLGLLHYATVDFTVHAHNTWDGDCWQPLLDEGIVMCFEEFPCTYQRELTASYTNGPNAIPGHDPHVSWTGVDCDGRIGGSSWLIGGENFDHPLWSDVLGVACGGQCSVGFQLTCGYGIGNNPAGPLMIPLLQPINTDWAHTFTCSECSQS